MYRSSRQRRNLILQSRKRRSQHDTFRESTLSKREPLWFVAFACGVPVIGSDSGEVPHVIGDAGRIVPEGDVGGWASDVVELLERPELRSEFGRRGRQRCRAYAVTTVAEQYRGYYRWLAEQPVL
ncbi:MAG: glycosyltransferase [Planctomycetaceae bacterium]|nr:glycosyltransferase [Planctomycetaceae bacterium]